MFINKITKLIFKRARLPQLLIVFFFIIAAMALALVATSSPNSQNIIAAVTIVSVVFAAISSYASIKQVNEMQRQREQLERPYILGYFEINSSQVVFFVIENFGTVHAADVRVSINPPPIDARERPINELSLFNRPISILPAGRKFQQIIDVGHKFLEISKVKTFEISVSYSSLTGEKFIETDTVDLTYLMDATLPRKTDTEHLEDISHSLEDLVRRFNQITTTESLLTEAPEQYKMRKLNK